MLVGVCFDKVYFSKQGIWETCEISFVYKGSGKLLVSGFHFVLDSGEFVSYALLFPNGAYLLFYGVAGANYWITKNAAGSMPDVKDTGYWKPRITFAPLDCSINPNSTLDDTHLFYKEIRSYSGYYKCQITRHI